MNFDFSEEQQMVRDSIARFVQDDYDWDTNDNCTRLSYIFWSDEFPKQCLHWRDSGG